MNARRKIFCYQLSHSTSDFTFAFSFSELKDDISS